MAYIIFEDGTVSFCHDGTAIEVIQIPAFFYLPHFRPWQLFGDRERGILIVVNPQGRAQFQATPTSQFLEATIHGKPTSCLQDWLDSLFATAWSWMEVETHYRIQNILSTRTHLVTVTMDQRTNRWYLLEVWITENPATLHWRQWQLNRVEE